MRDGTPIFEWKPGQQVEDMWSEELGGVIEEEEAIPPLVENGIIEGGEDNEATGLDIEEEQNIVMGDNEDEEGLMVVPEDNIVSDDETFIEDESDRINDVEAEAPQDVTVEEAVVADVDDVPMTYDRPRRANAGAGVERLQMDFSGKGYQAKREFNLITNSAEEIRKEDNGDMEKYMNVACNVMFTQMTAKKGIERYGA